MLVKSLFSYGFPMDILPIDQGPHPISSNSLDWWKMGTSSAETMLFTMKYGGVQFKFSKKKQSILTSHIYIYIHIYIIDIEIL